MILRGQRLALIGGGNMAEAMVRGLLNARAMEAKQIVVTGPRPERLEHFRKTYAVEATPSNLDAVARADIVLFAVKPQILDRLAQEVAASITPTALVVSI